MRALLALAVALFAGCFGDGPVPTAPSKATILYQLAPSSNPCNGPQQYIGPVSFGAAGVDAFVGLLPYQNSLSCDNTGTPPSQSVEVDRFPLSGGPSSPTGATAGQSDGTYSPRLMGVGMSGFVTFSAPGNNSGQNLLDIVSSQMGVPAVQIGTNGPFAPAAIMTDGTTTWAAATPYTNPNMGGGGNNAGKVEPNNPNYPCCGITPQITTGNVWAITNESGAYVQMPVNPALDCAHSSRCLTMNDTKLIYLAFNTSGGGGWKIATFSKAYVAEEPETVLVSIPSGGLAPVGFHFNGSKIAWAKSRSYDNSSGVPTPSCEIDLYDLDNGMDLGPLFSTESYDCAGIAMDDNFVYFTIVEHPDSNHQHGLGIGRVPLDAANLHLDSERVESIRFSVFGATSGPRRLFNIDENNLMVIDPFAIGRIEKSVLEGQHDFAP